MTSFRKLFSRRKTATGLQSVQILETQSARPQEEAEEKVRLFRFLVSRYGPLVVGALFLLAATAVEHVEWGENGTVVPSVIFQPHYIIHWVSEVGYACIIAWMVSMFIEQAARRDHAIEVRRAREEIKEDVFNAIFGVRHDAAYLRTVVERMLEAKFVRKEYTVTYAVKGIHKDQNGQAPDRIKMQIRIRYKLQNLGYRGETISVSYGLPTISGLEDLVKVTYWRIGNVELNQEQITKIRSPEIIGEQVVYAQKVLLQPGQPGIDVAIDASLIKDLADTEIFGFLHPTMGMQLHLDLAGNELVFGARARCPTPIEEINKSADKTTGEWRVNGPILPHNSVILWWRKAPVAGAKPPEQLPQPSSVTV